MKISKRIPARTETKEISWLKKDFMEMSDEYRKIRAKFRYRGSLCYWCKHEFENGDMMALVCIKKSGNKMFCQDCAGKIEE